MAEKKKKEPKEIHAWNTYTAVEKKKVYALAEDYRAFISNCMTERESAVEAERMARAAGYIPLESASRSKRRLKPGDKVYATGMKKTLVLFHIGKHSG